MSSFFNFSSGEVLSVDVENDFGYITNETDIEAIKWAINSNGVEPKFRIFVLYPDETIAYEIPPADIKQGGSYSENYQNGQRRSLDFTLYNQDGRYTPDVNTFWVGTRLRFDMGLKIVGGKTYWFRKGTFVIKSVSPTHEAG